jgi:hypothetical protein
MNAQLTDISRQLRANSKRAQDIVAKAGPNRIGVRPRENAWSIAECLGHLTISTSVLLPVWPKALAEARGRGLTGQGPYGMDLLGRVFAWLLEPPARFLVKAPANLMPPGAEPSRAALTQFLAIQEKLLGVVADADGLAIDRIKIPSPVNPRLRYNVWSSFCLTAAHQRRHLWQAERVLSA